MDGMHEGLTVDFVFVRDAGRHLIASSATTKNVVDKHALTKSAPRALGAVAMAADMAKVVKPRSRVDVTAPKAIASRRGVARVRHLHTHVLWVQEAVARRADHRESARV